MAIKARAPSFMAENTLETIITFFIDIELIATIVTGVIACVLVFWSVIYRFITFTNTICLENVLRNN